MLKYTAVMLGIMMLLSAPVFTRAGDQNGSRRLKTLPPPAGTITTTRVASALQNLVRGIPSRRLAAPGAPIPSYGQPQNALPIELLVPARSNPITIDWNASTGVPHRIRVASSATTTGPPQQALREPVSVAQSFLSMNSAVLRIDNPAAEFSVMSSSRDERGFTHIRFRQSFSGIELWASDVYVHCNPQGSVYLFNGSYYPTPRLTDINANVGSAQALHTVQNDLETRGEQASPAGNPGTLPGYAAPRIREYVWHDDSNGPHLVWHVEIRTALDRDWYYFVDAQNGAILDFYNNTRYDGPVIGSGIDLNGVQRSFGTFQTDSNYVMIDASEAMFDAVRSNIPQNPLGAIVTLDLRGQDLLPRNTAYEITSANNYWPDSSSVSAHYYAARVYEYYRDVFGRNSIDDSGMTITSIIHVTDGRRPMDNAFWSGEEMCYGDGRYDFKPLAGAFDVAIHELTHGVTQHTANLVYRGQSGALDESISDAFAVALDSANWTLGEQIIKDTSAFPSGCIRSLSDPHNGAARGKRGWQPATMAEYFRISTDNGGVHINSGIPNYAFYLVATAVGRPTAATIWYRALTHYLTSSASFIDARIATEEAADEFYGASSSELAAVQKAWDDVQVIVNSTPQPPPVTQVTGENWILGVNTDPDSPTTLYISRPVIQSTADEVPLTTTGVLSRPAVSDTSGLILFVDTNHRLRALYASRPDQQESILDTNQIWWSVAVSPGDSSVALTSKYLDTTIYYINIITGESRQFDVCSCTSTTPATQTTLYADAISFDPTGRFILFDSYNRKQTATGDTIFFWTINLLDTRTGAIQDAFRLQGQGISVSNPSFSKLSPNRFTYDYSDSNLNTRYVLATDIQTARIGIVAGPLEADFAYPTYSGNDKTVAYHAIDTINGVSHETIRQIDLDSTMLRSIGSSSPYHVDATYPVWFVIGTRVTDIRSTIAAALPASPKLFQNYPNPFNPTTTIGFSISRNGYTSLKVYNMVGEVVASLLSGELQAGSYAIDWNASGFASGIYFYRLTHTGYTQTRKLILLK